MIRIFSSLLCLMVVFLSGCSRSFNTQYGETRGVAGDESINGFGTLRRTFKSSGWSIGDAKRLNKRLDNVQTLVWIPTSRDELHQDAMDWIETWLTSGTRRLVYVVPDNRCDAEYFQVAKTLASPDQQLEYRRRLAEIQSEELTERLQDTLIPENGWFALHYVSGDDATLNRDQSDWLSGSPESAFSVRVQYGIKPPAISTAPATTTNASSALYYHNVQGTSAIEKSYKNLIAMADGSGVVTAIGSKDWGDSKILVVSSGSLLCNFSLASDSGSTLASQLIQACGDVPGNVAFMTTDDFGATVSELDPDINAVTGLELFSVWPLSLVMLHLAVIGFVACMILLPIFGRPKTKAEESTSDFSDHLDAVATLMNRSGGESFARRRVSDYMKRVRGEATGPWVLPDSKPPTPIQNQNQNNPPPAT